MTPPPPLPPAKAPEMEKKLTVIEPTFLGALRGIWLFTWRSQLAWRRVPVGLLSLLALPMLIYLTTSSPRAWVQRPVWPFNPAGHVEGFSRRLTRAKLPMDSEQRKTLLAICQEEYQVATAAPRDNASPETSVEEQSDQIKACYERIQTRAQRVLNEPQMVQFQSYHKRRLEESLSKLGGPRWNRTGPFYHWLVDFYFFMILPLSCARTCGGLIRDELQADTLGFLTTRPVSRAKLLVVKYLSQTAWLQVIALVEAMLLFGAGWLREMPSLGHLLAIFIPIQALAVVAWSALGALLGQLSRRYMALALLYGFLVELGIGRIPTNINTLSMMRHFKSLLSFHPALQATFQYASESLWISVGAIGLAAAVFLGLSALLFSVREQHNATEAQK